MTEEKAPRTIVKPTVKTTPVVEEMVVEEVKETRVVSVDGVRYDVPIVWDEHNRAILAKSIYRTASLPNTKKTTQILVLAKGTAIQGY